MRPVLLVLIIFRTTGAQISHIPGQSCDISFVKHQVVGGEDNIAENVPWNAVLEMKRDENAENIKTFCGGSIVSKRAILTAAHCVWGNNGCPQNVRNQKSANECHEMPNGCPSGCLRVRPQDLNVYLGITSIRQTDRTPRPVEKILLHEEWDKSSTSLDNVKEGHDMALIILKTELEFGPKISPICIPDHQLNLRSGSFVKINGFGYVNAETKTLAEHLQTGSMRIKAKDDCGTEYDAFTGTEGTLHGDQLCSYANGTDSCKGDSGSGLVKRVNSVPVLVGVVSFGHRYCKDLPGVYTNVQSHAEWILEKLNRINSEISPTFRRCPENETCEARETCPYIQQMYKEATEAKRAGLTEQRKTIINKLKSIICNKEMKSFCCKVL